MAQNTPPGTPQHTCISTDHLATMPSRHRAHLVNLLSGVKGLHLMGTQSNSGIDNLGLFNSVVHIGANPAALGVIFRPISVARDSYDNIQANGQFTLNLVTEPMVQAAHWASAKWPTEVSEFTGTGLSPWYSDKMRAPYVMESPISIGLSLVEEHVIQFNETRLLVGEVQEIWGPQALLDDDSWLRLDALDVMSVAGLDSYYRPAFKSRKSYAKPGQPPQDLIKG